MLVAGRFDYWLLLLITAQILNDLFLQFDQFTSEYLHLCTKCGDKTSVPTFTSSTDFLIGLKVCVEQDTRD